MGLLTNLFSTLFGVAQEAADIAIAKVKEIGNVATMTREEARIAGRQTMINWAAAHGAALDPASIDDRVKVLQQHARFEGTPNEIKQHLADELAGAGVSVLQNYQAGHGSGRQNDILVDEVDIMVGYGSIALRE